MGFLDVSTVNNGVVKSGPEAVYRSQNTTKVVLPSTPSKVSSSIADTIRVVTDAANIANSGNTNVLSQRIAKAVSSSNSQYLQQTLTSLNGIFSGSKTGLASGISGLLGNLFKDTNIKSASTTTRQVSDPVSTNITNRKTPSSTGFKIDSAEAGSRTISMSGSSSQFGSGADQMVGVVASTLFGRYNLDSLGNLGRAITDDYSTTKLNGLFSGITLDNAKIFNRTVTTNPLLVDPNSPLFNLSDANSLTNDITKFLSTTRPLADSLGVGDFSKFFLNDRNYSLLSVADNLRSPVYTNKSGVSADTANAIISLINFTGCTAPRLFYESANNLASLFNLSLNLSASNGMFDEVISLLGCSNAKTKLGQTAIATAFQNSAGSQLEIADKILDGFATPASLNTDTISKSILTNPYLKKTDVPLMNSVFEKLGSSTTKAMSVKSASSDRYPVYDASLMKSMTPSSLNGIFDSDVFTAAFGGIPMIVQSNGRLATG